MEGLEAVELSLGKVFEDNLSFRLDAEYYGKEFLNTFTLMRKKMAVRLDDITNRIDVGFVGAMVEEYREAGVKLLQTRNIDEIFLNESSSTYIGEVFHDELKKSQVNQKDILIARSGSFGKASIYLGEDTLNSSDIIIIDVKESTGFNPFYVVTFLNTTHGKAQMFRFASGGVQGHVNLTILENLKVPFFSENFQTQIENCIVLASQKLEISKAQFKDAEESLFLALGLANYKPTDENVSVKALSKSFDVSGRLDSEFYQPKFDQLFNALKERGNIETLETLTSQVQRGKQPIYTDEGYPVVNSKHVRTGKVVLDDNRTGAIIEKQILIEKGDLLMNGTGVGTIGRVAPYLHEQKALPDNHVTVIKSIDIDPIYLSIFLNSVAGQLQVEKYQKGSSGQIELYPDDIRQFLIWDAPKDIQVKIRKCVEASFQLENESNRLLDLAKRSVELAIKEGEDVAIVLIQGEMENYLFQH